MRAPVRLGRLEAAAEVPDHGSAGVPLLLLPAAHRRGGRVDLPGQPEGGAAGQRKGLPQPRHHRTAGEDFAAQVLRLRRVRGEGGAPEPDAVDSADRDYRARLRVGSLPAQAQAEGGVGHLRDAGGDLQRKRSVRRRRSLAQSEGFARPRGQIGHPGDLRLGVVQLSRRCPAAFVDHFQMVRVRPRLEAAPHHLGGPVVVDVFDQVPFFNHPHPRLLCSGSSRFIPTFRPEACTAPGHRRAGPGASGCHPKALYIEARTVGGKRLNNEGYRQWNPSR